MIKERLKELRKERGLNQRELALYLKLSPSTIAMYETGQRIPDADTLEKLADYFNVSVDFILGRTDTPRPEPAAAKADEAKHSPIAFSGDMSDINIDALEKIINRAVKNALKERDNEGKEGQ